MKKFLKFAAVIAVLAIMAAPSWAANTVNPVDGTVTLSAIDSDWTFTSAFTGVTSGMRLISIRFNPGAADDILIVKQGSDTGPELFNSGKVNDEYDPRIQYYDKAVRRPYLDYSDCTFSSGATVTFEFDY